LSQSLDDAALGVAKLVVGALRNDDALAGTGRAESFSTKAAILAALKLADATIERH
jgi:hypothetical protein